MRLTIHEALPMLGVAALWLTAVVLMGVDFADGSRSVMGRLALLIGLAAGCGTLMIAMKHCRRVILEVMSWEHRMYDRRVTDTDRAERSNVRAIR